MRGKVDALLLLGRGKQAGFCELTIDALAKEKLACRIDGQAEEESLDVELGSPTGLCLGDDLEEVLDMAFLEFEVGDLIADKIGLGGRLAPSRMSCMLTYPKQCTAVLPGLAVLYKL